MSGSGTTRLPTSSKGPSISMRSSFGLPSSYCVFSKTYQKTRKGVPNKITRDFREALHLAVESKGGLVEEFKKNALLRHKCIEKAMPPGKQEIELSGASITVNVTKTYKAEEPPK